MAEDEREDVVEVVSDAPGEPPHRLHFLRLTELILGAQQIAFRLLATGILLIDGPEQAAVRDRACGVCTEPFEQELVVRGIGAPRAAADHERHADHAAPILERHGE